MTVRIRPKIKIPVSPTEVAIEVACGAALAFMAGTLYFNWARIPQTIPTHFGLKGTADAWGGKETLPILLAVTFGLYLMLTLVRRFPWACNMPVRITEENAERQYRIAADMMSWMKLEIIWFLAYLEWQMVQIALQRAKSLDPAVIVLFLGALAVTTIGQMIRSYRAK